MTSRTSSGSSTRRTVMALFDRQDDAVDAVKHLIEAGVTRDDIRMMPSNERDLSDDAGVSSTQISGDIWEAFAGLFLPNGDRHMYAEGLRLGGYLVSVSASDDQYPCVLDILDDEGTIDLDERAESWRAEGWSAPADNLTPTAPEAALSGPASRTPDTMVDAGLQSHETGAGNHGIGDENVMPVAAEQPRIAKRDISHGKTRVRSYVVEPLSKR